MQKREGLLPVSEKEKKVLRKNISQQEEGSKRGMNPVKGGGLGGFEEEKGKKARLSSSKKELKKKKGTKEKRMRKQMERGKGTVFRWIGGSFKEVWGAEVPQERAGSSIFG